MSDDGTLANSVKSAVTALNAAIKNAVAAGLMVRVEEERYSRQNIDERPRQQFVAEVARRL